LHKSDSIAPAAAQQFWRLPRKVQPARQMRSGGDGPDASGAVVAFLTQATFRRESLNADRSRNLHAR
jgi:hypothetical protein